MYTLTAADFADTGQWRLLLLIKETGMEAFLENTLHPEIGEQVMCRALWEPEPGNILKNLEETVYNYPRLLDDFATRIVIYDRRTLFVPSEIAENRAGYEEELYNKIYSADPRDIMTEKHGGITAIWSFAPGVKSFLMRTFPGARITCNLMEMIKRKDSGCRIDHFQIYENVRDGEIDLVLMEGNNLLSASTHTYSSKEEIETLKANLLKSYSTELQTINP